MFGINTVRSGIREKEEYYTQDESLAQSKDEIAAEEKKNSQSQNNSHDTKLTTAYFYGKGAVKLGLEGAVTREQFNSLFYGEQPGTKKRIRGHRPSLKTDERLAEDITLSAPKSLSIALHQGRDNRLFDAHTEAVTEVIDVIEQRYIKTREYVEGQQQIVNTGNLIAALIPHHTSRDGDMQLHTHGAIFNGTERPDGKYCALHTNAIANQKWLGHLYQALLAQKVQKLGYPIRETKDGFEIEGISKKQIEVFSKRSRAIIQKLEREGIAINHRNRDKAALLTRKAKNTTQTLQQYRQQWLTEAKAHGIVAPIPQAKPVKPKPSPTAASALDSAIAHLSETSVSFRRDKIYEYIYQSGLQTFSLSELDRKIQTNRELIPLNDEATKFTTVKATLREIETARQWLNGQKKAKPLLENPELSPTKLNQGQEIAIEKTLTSKDKHQIIHGLSGVGKTTALGVLRNQLRGTDVVIKGFAPTIEAAKVLEEELDIETQTVARLTLATPENKPNQLWIIDEAGLMSAKAARAIVEKAESVGARLLLVGDKGQNSSVEAGSPLKSLMKHGATTHRIDDIIRQQDSVQKQAVELIAQGNGIEALELLESKGYLTEIENREERTRAVAKEYLKLSPKERGQTLVVTGTNQERRAITQEIRKGLFAEGKLGKSIKTVQLTSRNLSKEQQSKTQNYRTGDYIKLFRDYQSTNLQKGQLYKVEKVGKKELVVSSSGGRFYRFDPSKYKDKQVFSSRQMEIAVGDKLRWSGGSDKKKGQINGKQVSVTAVSELSLTVTDYQGKSQEVSLLQPLPLDYNWVSTSYRAQGKSKKRVIVSATDDPTSSLESFYVEISRQKSDLKIYTENRERLKTWVQNSNAQQNPLEVIEQNYGKRSRDTFSYKRTKSNPNSENRQSRTTNFQQPKTNRKDNSVGSQPIHSTVNRTLEPTQRQRSGRVNSRIDSSNGISKNYNRTIPTTTATVSPTGVRIELSGLEELAGAISSSREEEELINALDNAQEVLQQFEQNIQQQKVTSPDEEIIELNGLSELAIAISSSREEKELINALLDTSTLLQEFEQNIQQKKLKTLSQSLERERLWQFQFEDLDKLAGSMENYSVRDVLFQSLETFNLTVVELQQKIQSHLDRIADSLSQNQTVESSSNPQLQELADSFKDRRSTKPFWQPTYSESKPRHIQEKHWQEFQQSAIHPDLIALNAESIKDNDVFEALLADKLAKLGKVQYVTQAQKKVMLRYETVAEGGWWGKAGIDALSLIDLKPGEQPGTTLWGCFKPDNPRIDSIKSAEKGKTKYRKYENPAGSKRVPFLPEVSDRLAEKIYQKYNINPTAAERKSGFWYVVKQYNEIPITITEGFKKTLSSLSQGEVTIGLTGVNHIYRSTDENKNKLPQRELNPEIAVFATNGREFRIAYDQDVKAKTIVNVRRDMVRGIELLEATGSQVKVLKWNPEDGKGLDDLIVNNGAIAYSEAHQNAISSELDKKIHYRTEYNKLAKRVRQSLGNNIGEERLDLEIYIAAVLKGEKADGIRVISESDRVRSYREKHSPLTASYQRAISSVAGTYRNLAQKNTPNLDFLARKTIEQQMAQNRVKSQDTIILQEEQHQINCPRLGRRS